NASHHYECHGSWRRLQPAWVRLGSLVQAREEPTEGKLPLVALLESAQQFQAGVTGRRRMEGERCRENQPVRLGRVVTIGLEVSEKTAPESIFGLGRRHTGTRVCVFHSLYLPGRYRRVRRRLCAQLSKRSSPSSCPVAKPRRANGSISFFRRYR